MKWLLHQFKNRKIRQKLLLSNIGIILIMVLIQGGFGYVISRKLLVERSVESSKNLMEQLSSNFNYAVKALEDAVLMQTYNNDFAKLIRNDNKDAGGLELYYRKREVETYSYNLINFHKSIKTVIVEDNYKNLYYVSENQKRMSEEEQRRCTNFEKVYEMWGTTDWQPYDEHLVFASRLVFDYQTMKPIGVISIGVDTAYFQELYQNIVEDEANSIVVLNQNREILMESSAENRKIAEAIMEKYAPIKASGKEVFYNNKKYIYTTWMTEGNGIQVMNLISEEAITSVIFHLLRPLLLSAILAVIMASLLAFGISDQISANIKLLLENIRKISKGDFSKKIVPETYDEIGMLAEEFNVMSGQIQQLLTTVTNEKILKKNSELKALQFEYDSLQAKINPHFLYNTLESINSLAKLQGADTIADSIFLLGNYLREAISSKKIYVTLEEEIQNIRNYIKIQQLSYGDKITVTFDIAEALGEIAVPKLILQPLVENSIVHGIEPKIGRGNIKITAVCDKRDLVITVWDDGVGIPEAQLKDTMNNSQKQPGKHTKVGLMAVDKRVRILYGEPYGIEIDSKEERGTCITVRLPIRFEGEVS